MATKVIKLQDNNNILIPVTDASVVQMSVEGQVKSVKDVIIENEKVTAAGYNNLNSRVIALEESPGIDKVGTLTDVKVNNTSVVSNDGVANIPMAANNKLGAVALGYTNANKGYALKVDSNGKGYVNVPWTDTKTEKSGHYSPTGTATNATYVNGNLTQSTGSVPLTHGSSLVITGVKYNKDEKGHVTDISYSLGKLPSVSATISYQASSLGSAGVVSGVVKNNLNRTSGNVTTIRTVGEVEQPSGGTGTARTILRYETPLINIAKGTTYTYTEHDGGHIVRKTGIKSTFPAPSSTTVNKNYYDPVKNNTKKANIYGTDATNVTYAPMVDGNNYCDVSNSTYEMYFFNTNKLRNYLTAYARIDVNKSYLKEINEDAILQWDTYDNDNGHQETLTLKKNEISFNKKYTLFLDNNITLNDENRTIIKPKSIQTNTFIAYSPSMRKVPYIEMSSDAITVGSTILNEGPKVSITPSQSTFNHTAYAVKFEQASDERLKTNISPIAYDPDGIGIYSFIKNNYDSYSYGFIAQNVEETHPELVSENTVTSYLAVDYDSTLSLLLAKALNRIDALEKRVLELEKASINDPELI